MDILWLDEPDCQQLGLVGGKTANLSRLAAGYPVPPGFCLTTLAFEKARKAGGAERITGIPPSIEQQIASAYARLAERCQIDQPAVAVRSSAVDEDGLTASFAGQHETFLNVAGTDAVIDAVSRCWSSVWSERAIAYRQQRGMPGDQVQLAVLVQRLIESDVSAVVFSANPITSDRDEIVINATWGLGESLVAGLVTPDTYLVTKRNLAIRERRIAAKERMTVPTADGTDEVPVPRFLREQPAMNDDEIRGTAALARDLEAAMRWPVDIECAYKDGQLYLLQCRPITTLEPIPATS